MERLNEIMTRTSQRRQPLNTQRSPQDDAAQRARPARPLSEQTARLDQPLARASQPPRSQPPDQYGQRGPSPRVRETQSGSAPSQPTSRPTHLRPRPTGNRPAAYQSRPSQAPDPGYAPAPQRRGDYYAPDDYGPALAADALEEWEDEEVGMRYGDWESDENEAQMYLRSNADPLSRGDYLQTTREMPALPPPESRAHITRNLRELPAPVTPPPVSRAVVQTAQSYHRITQPLRPRALPGSAYDALPEPPQAQPQRTSRQPGAQDRQDRYPAVPGTALSPVKTRGVCPRCRGAGYLRQDVPFGYPGFGKPVPCSCKDAVLKEKRRQQLRGLSNLDAFRNKSFKTFNTRVPGVQQALQAAENFALDPDGWLLLIGPNGCGKTHLAAAIANLRLENGSLVLFATVPDLLDHLRAAFAPTSNEVYDQLFARMREAELLVLDDLGTQQSSPWANEKLFQLLNYRYNSRFPTVITANNKGLQAVDERIRSRLSDAGLVTAITFDGSHDYRPRNPR
ncbi:MAG: ATP-binding protein [Chloroflexota bacterium]|nr:ATP-binding protein [Chloroflexota bacterium]